MKTNNIWDDLVFALRRQECILALGTGISTAIDTEGAERPIAELFAAHLANLIERENNTVEGDRNNLFQMSSEFVLLYGHTALHREMIGFYERFPAPSAIQSQLAALPFHLILNAAPDTLMVKALEKNNKIPELIYYKPPGQDRTQAYRNIVKPTVSRPLVFNMLGSWTDPGSVILTESDQLDFLEDIIRHSDAIPNSLLEICKAEKSTFVFSGFDFERWQLRMLLRALKLDGAEKIAHWAVQKPETQQKDTVLFFKNQYGVHFLNLSTAQFVEELTKQYTSTDPPAPVATPARLHAVCLYAKEDEGFRKELDVHLAPLREHQQVETWSDAMIEPGEVVEDAIQKAIDNAQLIIVLASADFVASERLYHEHLERAIERFKSRKAKIFPVIVRDFVWTDTLFGQLPIVLPQENGSVRPLVALPERDRVYADLVSLILRHVKYLLEDLKTT